MPLNPDKRASVVPPVAFYPNQVGRRHRRLPLFLRGRHGLAYDDDCCGRDFSVGARRLVLRWRPDFCLRGRRGRVGDYRWRRDFGTGVR